MTVDLAGSVHQPLDVMNSVTPILPDLLKKMIKKRYTKKL